ncbi:alpha-2Db adrenergic receptor-like [Amphiura filiformis]|uniref:alpha-2Db adrenergic receptor-like n=1 Tax=Amphiura filiformis TaxID=82378 RepID=UPI003B21FECE
MAAFLNDSFTTLIPDDMLFTSTVAERLPNPPSGFSEFRIISSAIIVAIIVVIIVVGNSLVCIAVTGNDRSLKSIQYWFLVSLAAADLMVGVLIMPLGIVANLYGCWVFGPFLCLLWLVLDVLACTASILSLCLISLDRYFCITKPIQYAKWRTGRRARIMIASVWVLSTMISVPPLFGWRDQEEPQNQECLECNISNQIGYILYSTMGSFFIPAFVMVVFYIKIWGAAKRHARTALRKPVYGKSMVTTTQAVTTSTRLTYELVDTDEPNQKCHSPNSNAKSKDRHSLAPNVMIIQDAQSVSRMGGSPDSQSNGNIDVDEGPSQYEASCAGASINDNRPSFQPGETSRRKRKLAQARERRATVILGIIMGTFLLCWFPFFGLYVITALCGEKCVSAIPPLLFEFFFWIGYCNSALNPIIYTIFNREFRKAFKRILHIN